jgi:hypothetical protein
MTGLVAGFQPGDGELDEIGSIQTVSGRIADDALITLPGVQISLDDLLEAVVAMRFTGIVVFDLDPGGAALTEDGDGVMDDVLMTQVSDIFRVVQECGGIQRRTEEDDLPLKLEEFIQGGARAIAIVEGMIGCDPGGLGTNGDHRGFRVEAALTAGPGAQKLGQHTIIADGTGGGGIERRMLRIVQGTLIRG